MKRNGNVTSGLPDTEPCHTDKPENLDKKGFKDAWFKAVELKILSNQTRKLQLCAYRSGTGTSMSLVMSTSGFGCHWDFQFLNPKDSIWYHDTAIDQDA